MRGLLKKNVASLLVFSLLITSVIYNWNIASVNAADDKIIVFDPGHGGSDVGTDGSLNGTAIYEKNLNLKVARYAWEYLSEYKGAKVYLTRDDDTKISVLSRCTAAKDLNADLMISFHMNALENASYFKGSEIFVSKGQYRPELAEITNEIGTKILSKFENLGMKKIGVKTKLLDSDPYYNYANGQQADYYGIIRESVYNNIPAMIIEHGYLSNKDDLAFLSKDENLKKLAQATVQAIVEKYGLTKPGGSQITLKKQDNVILADIPTTLKVGDPPIQLKASGGSGNGKMHFESNDKNVLQIKGDQLVIVGEGKANITAVRGTDGTYAPMTSQNFVRITVQATGKSPVTANPDLNTPDPIGSKTPSVSGNPADPSATATNGPKSIDEDDSLKLVIAIVGGILAAIAIAIIIRIIVVKIRRSKGPKNRGGKGRGPDRRYDYKR